MSAIRGVDCGWTSQSLNVKLSLVNLKKNMKTKKEEINWEKFKFSKESCLWHIKLYRKQLFLPPKYSYEFFQVDFLIHQEPERML